MWKQVSDKYNKLMVNKSAHEDLVAQVRVMCGYMLEGQAALSGSKKVVKDVGRRWERLRQQKMGWKRL